VITIAAEIGAEEKRARRRAYMKAWRAKDPERRRASDAAYRANNKERIAANERAYRERHKEKLMAADRAYKKLHQEKIRTRNRDRVRTKMMRRYGLSQETYDAMLAKQGGVCAICGNGPGRRRLAIDHCHKTGIVRGLLCGKCNGGIGALGDTAEGCYRAGHYLAAFAAGAAQPW
jgi:hypothetical protein